MAEHGVDEVARELYAADPAAFVAARTAAVRKAREAGDRDLATAIGQLRRPSMSAWAVNLLVRSATAEVTELLALGDELRAAQQRLQGEQLRQLTQRRREMVRTLAQRATQLAAEAGHPLSSASTEEVEQTLVAALADPESAVAVRAGRLTRPLQHVGLGAEPLAELLPDSPVADSRAPRSRASAGRAGSPSPTPVESEASPRRRQRAERVARDMTRAYQELDEATAQVQRAEQQAGAVAEQCAELDRRIGELRRERDRVAREHADAQRRARSAIRMRDEAERRVQRLTEQSQAAP